LNQYARDDEFCLPKSPLSTVVMEGKMAKVLSWYDNEWGYSCRVGDLAAFMAEREL